MKEPVDSHYHPELENASLIVAWQEDACKLGPKVIDYLNKHIKFESFYEIEPVKYFSLNGVAVEKDVAQFPLSRFYSGLRKDLVIFMSNQPSYERYDFLNKVLDVCQHYIKIKELYTISGAITPTAHTTPRKLGAVYNQIEFQHTLGGYELTDMNWEGPPAINSYLLWLAQKRGIRGVSLWSDVAFYLATSDDPRAVKSVLSFFNSKFDLGLNFAELDSQIKSQSEKLAALRTENTELDKYIRTLEVGLSLNQEEQFKLAQGVAEFFENTES